MYEVLSGTCLAGTYMRRRKVGAPCVRHRRLPEFTPSVGAARPAPSLA